jgi:hypothetical protein
LSDLKEPKPGDTVEIVSLVSRDAPLGSRWEVRAVFDGVLNEGRYLDLVGLNFTPAVHRVEIVKTGEPRNE